MQFSRRRQVLLDILALWSDFQEGVDLTPYTAGLLCLFLFEHKSAQYMDKPTNPIAVWLSQVARLSGLGNGPSIKR